MKMHNHDLDLIAALAEGRLDADQARSAEESFAGCDECSTNLMSHRASLAATATAERPGLTMAESSELRRQVGDAVGLSPRIEKAPQRRPWMGLATAAAVVIALIAVAPLVNLLSTDSDDAAASATTIAVTQEVAESPTAADSAEAPLATAAPATEAPFAQAPVGAAEGGAAEFSGRLDRDAALPESLLDFGNVDDLDKFLNEVPQGIENEAVSRALTLLELSYYRQEFAAATDEVAVTCTPDEVLELADTADSVITIGTADFAGTEFLILLVTLTDETRLVLALDAVNCEVLAQVEQ
ncbi:MAG: hypothetical protein V3R84_02835 [Acidimicrobiia bacterium]